MGTTHVSNYYTSDQPAESPAKTNMKIEHLQFSIPHVEKAKDDFYGMSHLQPFCLIFYIIMLLSDQIIHDAVIVETILHMTNQWEDV